MFRHRTRLVRDRLVVIEERWNKINESLQELQESKDKLTSSRMLAEERQKLGKALGDLAGSARTGMAVTVTDPELRNDLKHAHAAVTLAEALLEVKAR